MEFAELETLLKQSRVCCELEAVLKPSQEFCCGVGGLFDAESGVLL